MHDRSEVPLVIAPSEMLVGEIVQVRPVEGEMSVLSEMVPVKPLRPETVVVEELDEPDGTLTLVGFAANVKSWIV